MAVVNGIVIRRKEKQVVQFVRANIKKDRRELMKMDRQIYLLHDCWDAEDFAGAKVFWIVADGRTAGWLAFFHEMRFRDGENWRRSPGWLYLANTGILKEYRRHIEVEDAVCRWQIEYAKKNEFRWISTNERASNPNIPVFLRHGFIKVKSTQGYWEQPSEPNVVLEMSL